MGANGKAQSARAGKIKVLLVEDYPLVREALLHGIGQEQGLKACGCASNAKQAMTLLERARPDVVIMDLFLDGTDGLGLIKRMVGKYPDLPILALSLQDEAIYAERVLRAGGKGYLNKKAELPEIMTAIREVATGRNFFSTNIKERLWARVRSPGSHNGDPVESLSDRELHVFRLVGKGVNTRTIASRLKISVKTVETYRSNIKEKLSLKNGTELVRYAVGWCQDKRM